MNDLILGVGTPHSATRSVYKTLNKRKLVKEPNILSYILAPEPEHGYAQNIRGKYLKFGVKFFDNPTLDDYIEYSKLYPVDFSNTYGLFSRSDIECFADRLLSEFKVKVLMIFRDPVRRLFSHLNVNFNTGHSLDNMGQNERFKKVLDSGVLDSPPEVGFPDQDWNHEEKYYSMFMFSNYNSIYENWNAYFDTHAIIMEDLWAGRNNELEKLNTFLGTNITEMYPNVYYPDMGINPIQHKGLRDQWSSETEYITKDNLERGREKMSWAYTIQGRNPWETYNEDKP
tara:strand:+ start:1851 stop:2705 length:855 start_codon:yes stop_codon:yes gene_type:complete